jgi:hypothetical protein
MREKCGNQILRPSATSFDERRKISLSLKGETLMFNQGEGFEDKRK